LRVFLYHNFSHLGAFGCEKITLYLNFSSFCYRSPAERFPDEVPRVEVLKICSDVTVRNRLIKNSTTNGISELSHGKSIIAAANWEGFLEDRDMQTIKKMATML
jgi:hypothetical protein